MNANIAFPRLRRAACLAAALLILAGCQTTASGNRHEIAINRALDSLDVERGEVIDSVPNFRITGWHAINDSYLIVTAGMHNHYLLSVAPPCLGLDFAFGISFERRAVALSRGDFVLVNSLHRPGRERCQILDITRLVDRNDNAD